MAFDASNIRLPNTKELKIEFSAKSIGNSTGKMGEYVSATYEACYDVLNNIAIQSSLSPSNIYEADLAEKMIDDLKSDDLAIFDRGYTSYFFMALLIARGKHFVMRCSKSCFVDVNNMFAMNAPENTTVLIDAPAKQRQRVNEAGLPMTIKIRLSRIILSSGEIEVLATTLFNENDFSATDLKALYGLRWGVETFFSKIKGRLGLENFTGKTLESVKQDFWSTVFISNFETIMTEDVEQKINQEKPVENKRIKINKAVSFNAIKKMAFDIFFKEKDKSLVFEKLDSLFSMNSIIVRENRKVPRKKTSHTRSFNFQKMMRKHVF